MVIKVVKLHMRQRCNHNCRRTEGEEYDRLCYRVKGLLKSAISFQSLITERDELVKTLQMFSLSIVFFW